MGIYQNSNFSWTKILLTDDFEGGEDVEVLDMDGDEDLDVVAAGSSGKLVWWENETPVGIFIESNNEILHKFSLEQNYPNPFNPITKISYQIPEPGIVSLKIYNVLGKEITTMVNEKKSAGEYEVEFDGSKLSSGIYFYRLFADGFSITKKMLLLK